MNRIITTPRTCSGCGAEDARELPNYGWQCSSCETLLDRYNDSHHDLVTLLRPWLAKWQSEGLSAQEASEHLRDAMNRVSDGEALISYWERQAAKRANGVN
jgi:hypothetical protein